MSTQADTQFQAALATFRNLPGSPAYSIANTTYQGGPRAPEISAGFNEDQPLFCASAFKIFVLAAYLHYAELGQLSPQLPKRADSQANLTAALSELLTVEDADLTQGSKVFCQMSDDKIIAKLTGKTVANVILDAMISYSDNTATDLAMKHVGVARVREFMYGRLGLDK